MRCAQFVLFAAAAEAAASAASAAKQVPSGIEELRAQAKEHAAKGDLTLARSFLKSAAARLRGAADAPADGHADVLGELGAVYARLGMEAEAIAVHEEALELLVAAFGNADARTGIVVDRLGDAHVRAGAHAQALSLYRDLLSHMRKGLGEAHPGYLRTSAKVARAALDSRQYGAAASAYRRLLSLLEGPVIERGSVDADVANAYLGLSQALAGAGKLEKALAAANKARDTFERADGAAGAEGAAGRAGRAVPGSLEHAKALNGVAGVLERLGRDAEAVAAMAHALELATALPGIEPDVVAAAAKNLAGLKRHVDRKAAAKAAASAPKAEL